MRSSRRATTVATVVGASQVNDAPFLEPNQKLQNDP